MQLRACRKAFLWARSVRMRTNSPDRLTLVNSTVLATNYKQKKHDTLLKLFSKNITDTCSIRKSLQLGLNVLTVSQLVCFLLQSIVYISVNLYGELLHTVTKNLPEST